MIKSFCLEYRGVYMNEDIIRGLTDKEIQERIDKKQVNFDTSVPTKSIKQIIIDNFFTLVNILN